MKTIYSSASKFGVEIKGEFTTKERAEADLFFNNYYCEAIITEQVEDDYFNNLQEAENRASEEAEYYQEPTQLDKYRMVTN